MRLFVSLIPAGFTFYCFLEILQKFIEMQEFSEHPYAKMFALFLLLLLLCFA